MPGKKTVPKPKNLQEGEGIAPSPSPSASSSELSSQISKIAIFTPLGCSLKYQGKYLLPGDKSDLADLDDAERAVLLAAGKIEIVSK